MASEIQDPHYFLQQLGEVELCLSPHRRGSSPCAVLASLHCTLIHAPNELVFSGTEGMLNGGGGEGGAACTQTGTATKPHLCRVGWGSWVKMPPSAGAVSASKLVKTSEGQTLAKGGSP